MNVHVMRGSPAEYKYRVRGGVPDLEPEVLAPGIPPTPAHDLLYHGGRTIPALTFVNFYVAGSAWKASDIHNIDAALKAVPTTTFKGSHKLDGAAPKTVSQGDVEQLVGDLFQQGKLAGFDYSATVFNFMLPQGTVLNDNPALSGEKHKPRAAVRRGVPEEEEVDSLHGLGGYHGSVHLGGTTVYYAVGVYSETHAGKTNGIPVFDQPWKNVVATFYHELNEARTDPDVEQVIAGGPSSLLGWTSKQGEECGDFPVFEANPLSLVFREVQVSGGKTVPVQLQYSNYVHGPEGPVANPDPPSHAHARHRKPAAA
jgi:hypothetical protein